MSQLNKLKKGYVEFGEKLILNRLYLNENKLLVKYRKSHAPLERIRQTPISDDLKSLLIDLIDTNKINIDLQKELNNDEMLVFETLMKFSRRKEELCYQRRYKDADDYIKRFQLLQASIVAGNTSNPLILNELVDIIHTLNQLKIITNDDAMAMISELQSII